MLKQVTAIRYITPFREGGSMPGLLEGDDDGMYVVKFRGAGQGVRVLIAECIAAILARRVGLQVPDAALIELPADLGRAEPDYEIRELLKASVGLNFALDFLPRSITFDPIAGTFPDPRYAARLVLFDALLMNVDRTAKNPNLLCWHGALYAIDHGASLYFHHDWEGSGALQRSDVSFPAIRLHVLLNWTSEASLDAAAEELRRALTPDAIDTSVDALPEVWLTAAGGFASIAEHRDAYRRWLSRRVTALDQILKETKDARAKLV